MEIVRQVLALSLLCSVALLIPATFLLFTVRREGHPATLVRALLAEVLVGAAVSAVGRWTSAQALVTAVSAVLMASTVLAWYPIGRPWATRGLVAWTITINTGLLYLIYIVDWTLRQDFGWLAMVASAVLWLLEAFVFVLALGYVWEMVDVLARQEWPRRAVLPGTEAKTAGPFVSLHVPAHNEPPDMVISTLQHLLEVDYQDYEILMIDDNTEDELLWRPVEEFCARHDRIKFFHLENWPGYKSGALNFALSQTDTRAEVVGVVDSDYQVNPDFLARCAPLFAESGVGFVQTPQDYREWEHAPYFRRLYHSYSYFFDVSQTSRNERDGAIFGGTMGLVRRHALVDVGGWDEWCITEDAELSLRLLRAGWSGRHVGQSFGHGIMPLTFEALKRQRYRWCFGGVQLLRMHWGSLMPWDRSSENKLTLSQRWAYLMGGLQWFGDLVAVAFTFFLLVGALDLVFGGGLVIRRLTPFLLLAVVTLVFLGAARSLALVRRTSGASWREAAGAFGVWVALGYSIAIACARGLFAKEGAFLVTPKIRGETSWRDALRGNPVETALGAFCLLTSALAISRLTLSGVIIGGMLALQGLGYAAAPLNSLAALRADLPADLRRRREKLPSWVRLSENRGRLVWVPAFALGAIAIALVTLAAPATAPEPGDLARDAGIRDPLPEEPGPLLVEDAPEATPSPTTPRRLRPSQSLSGTTGVSPAGQSSPSASPTAARPASTTAQAVPATANTSRPSAQPTGKPTAQPSSATSPPTPRKPTVTPTAHATGRP